MKQYEVGQILYLASEKSFKIIPVQVVEEVIRTTIKGKEKTYMIMFPDQEKTTVDIAKVPGNLLFKDAKSIREYMLENTRSAIDRLLHEANKVKSSVFAPTQPPEPEHPKDEVVQQEDGDVIIKVDLGNGQFGRIKKENVDKARDT
jgi:hypothetical protein